MPKIPDRKPKEPPKCKACGGTGNNSRGGPCEPCLVNLPALAKANYVRGQGQDREHHCHWPGCGKQCPPAQWGCKEHWFKLPKVLRDKVWAAYRPGQEKTMTPSREYLAVAREVEQWINDNYPAPTFSVFD